MEYNYHEAQKQLDTKLYTGRYVLLRFLISLGFWTRNCIRGLFKWNLHFVLYNQRDLRLRFPLSSTRALSLWLVDSQQASHDKQNSYISSLAFKLFEVF